MKQKLLATLALALLPMALYADDLVGQKELSAIVRIFFTPLGLAIGLMVAAVGVFQMFVSQNTSRGLMLIVLGVVITCFPLLYNGIRMEGYDIFTGIGGSGAKDDFRLYVTPSGRCPPQC